jgi:hypothetical protein
MLRLRSKLDGQMYDQLKPHHDAFTSKKALLEVWHKYHSNKCELLNNMITKFVPKKKHMCRTLSNKSRIYMAIGLDSVGYKEYFQRLFHKLGVNWRRPQPTTTETSTRHAFGNENDKCNLSSRKIKQKRKV